jgi:hypothetical protein
VATISLSALPFSTALIAPALTLASLAAGLAILLSRRRAVGETTLVSAWWWSLAALLAWSAVGVLPASEPLRFAAIGLSFCPAVSLVGAKRPQHLAWNFIVVSLWAIVVLPAAETFFLHHGRPMQMGDARGWFLWILVLLGPVNFVPTRHWLAGLLLAGGQIVALSQYLPLVRRQIVDSPESFGFYFAVAAMFAARVASVGISLRETPLSARGASGLHYDRLWLDFRDTFGLFWSLRVQERVNAAAIQYDWPLELSWSGFRDKASGAPLTAPSPAIEPVLRTTLKGLLRRFVSSRWIAERSSAGLN